MRNSIRRSSGSVVAAMLSRIPDPQRYPGAASQVATAVVSSAMQTSTVTAAPGPDGSPAAARSASNDATAPSPPAYRAAA